MMYQHCPSVLAVVYYGGMVGRVAIIMVRAGGAVRPSVVVAVIIRLPRTTVTTVLSKQY